MIVRAMPNRHNFCLFLYYFIIIQKKCVMWCLVVVIFSL